MNSKTLIKLLAVAAVIMLVVVAAGCTGNSSSGKSTTPKQPTEWLDPFADTPKATVSPTSAPTASPTQSSTPQHFVVGEVIYGPTIEFGATEFKRGDEVRDSNGKLIALSSSKDNEIVAYKVFVTNKKSSTLYPMIESGWSLYENGARCLKARNSATDGFMYKELMPGGTMTGWLAWEVKKGADVVLALSGTGGTAYIYLK